jgi:ribonuclease P protein component
MPPSGSGAPRRRRLSRSGDFKRAYREGSSKATRYLVLYRFRRSEDEDGEPRLGVTVSKKLGDSVTRNRIKRILKEAFWAHPDPDAGASDYVLVARSGIGKVIDERGLEGAIECVDEVTGRTSGSPGDPGVDLGIEGQPEDRST